MGDVEWSEEEKMDFVRLSMEFKSYKSPDEYNYKFNLSLYRDLKNEILYIDSPITQLLP